MSGKTSKFKIERLFRRTRNPFAGHKFNLKELIALATGNEKVGTGDIFLLPNCRLISLPREHCHLSAVNQKETDELLAETKGAEIITQVSDFLSTGYDYIDLKAAQDGAIIYWLNRYGFAGYWAFRISNPKHE